jgi:hypothetical protein
MQQGLLRLLQDAAVRWSTLTDTIRYDCGS